MNLYRIRRKDTKEFLYSLEGIRTGECTWGPSGSFWKRPDTIWRNLEKLCSEYKETRNEKWGFPWISYENFDGSKLALYEVIVNDVTVNGEICHDADLFISCEKLLETIGKRK